MIMQQWHAAATRQLHTHVSVPLLLSRRLTRARVASRYSVRTANMTGSGHGNKNLRTEPPFLHF